MKEILIHELKIKRENSHITPHKSQNSGITLVALIITIIVLLILAIVAIRAVTGDGIIQHAKNAQTGYEEAQTKEQGILSYYESYLSGTVGMWQQDGMTIKKVDSEGNSMEVKIGDKVDYNEGTGKTTTVDSSFEMKDLEWRVLGINESGQLELISTEATDSTLTLGGEDGYLNAVSRLNQICSDLYSTEIATARSLNVEDINKLAEITEEEKFLLSGGYGYGTWYRYRYDVSSEKIQSSQSTDYNPETKEGSWSTYVNSNETVFKEPGKTQIDSNNPNGTAEIKVTWYSYYLSDEIPSTEVTSDGILISSFINGNDVYAADGTTKIGQWLASSRVVCSDGVAQYEIRGLGWDRVTGLCLYTTWTNKTPHEWSVSQRVRPVVTLKSDVQLVDENGDGVLAIK